MINSRFIFFLASILSLLIGLGIYLLFRDISELFIFKLIPKLGFAKSKFIDLKPSILSNILSFNLPDMFWFLSGILFLRFIWFYNVKIQNIYLLCFYIIGAVFEISQLSKKIPGTFDLLDLLFLSIGAFFEGILYKNHFRRRLA